MKTISGLLVLISYGLLIQGFNEDLPAGVDNKTSTIDRSSHLGVDPTFKGFWRKKLIWRPRWVKTWNEKKVYVAIWKRMWGPVELKEWVPIPKPPSGWVKHDHGFDAVVFKKPHH